MRWIRTGSLFIGAALIIMQFFRPEKNSSRQQVTGSIATVSATPENVQAILRNACYDCHSNNTHYPWYASIQPAGWWLAQHVREGKEALNFDEYASYSAKRQVNKLKRLRTQLEEGKMPLPAYTWLHPAARLTPAEKDTVLKWVDALLRNKE
ncbi:heme-binding domain-containing protein [Chitinophaga arvensicola]|uniref:Haem-binding domain-containing protein n=1 Tax=Chitinophaga arvensicola TaxID=29529 RepID=A0A1I0S7I3_9BACT|nr:heme-binding domain-containing protein [Chitinophaga arvensicola]SEW51738.1 Haem-binding domain-containing protein [Chitinophaga arvensicola]